MATRRGFSLSLLTATLTLITAAWSAPATAAPPDAWTAASYRAYLHQTGATAAAAAFDALPLDRQHAVLRTVSDPTLAADIAAAMTGDAKTAVLADGDVVVTNEATTALAAATTRAWVRRSVKVAGITIMMAETWVTYTHSGNRVTRANDAGHRHVNYYPLNRLSANTNRPYVSGGRARAATTWVVETCAVVKPLCVQRSGTQRIAARPGSVNQSWN
jgi:hypothetical protein